MGLFDKMFGKEATAAVQAQPDAQQRFNVLKAKYGPVLAVIEQEKIQLRNLHVQDGKLYIKGAAPSEAAKAKAWDKLKGLNPSLNDITLDLTVVPSLATPAPAASGGKTYTVKSGD